MSRLYRQLDSLAEESALSALALRHALQAMIDSHLDCQSRSARMRLSLDLLAQRPALVTHDLSGWKSYPVRLDATLAQGVFQLRLQVSVGYSSTCPCSAALSRQLLEHGFLQAFAGEPLVEPDQVASWLRRHGTLATAHSLSLIHI